MKSTPGVFWDFGLVVFIALSLPVLGTAHIDPPLTGYVCKPGCQLIENSKCSCFYPPIIVYDQENQPTYECQPGCLYQDSKCFCLVPADEEEDPSGECPDPPTREELIQQCKKFLYVDKDPELISGFCSGAGKIRFADACSGETATLQCLPDQYIEIHSVFWGRRGKVKCDGYSDGNDCEDTEGKALKFVVSRCEFLNECSVETDGNKALGNPCKYLKSLLRIKYRCLPAESAEIKLRTDHVCMGSVLSLNCPHNEIIRPQYAIAGRVGAYGNPDDIPSCYHNALRHAADRARNSNSNVAKKCSNKNGCSISMKHKERQGFHDYPNTYIETPDGWVNDRNEWLGEYLKVYYYCVRPRSIYLGEGPLTENDKKKYRSNGQNFGDGESNNPSDESSAEEGG